MLAVSAALATATGMLPKRFPIAFDKMKARCWNWPIHVVTRPERCSGLRVTTKRKVVSATLRRKPDPGLWARFPWLNGLNVDDQTGVEAVTTYRQGLHVIELPSSTQVFTSGGDLSNRSRKHLKLQRLER